MRENEIAVDNEVYELLRRNAEPFVDTPNSVLRRLLGLPSENGRAPEGGAPEATSADGTQPRAASSTRRRRRSRGKGAERARPGTILADDAYEIPILDVLDRRGGRAPTREVLDEVGEQLQGQLLPADHESLATGEVRWRNRTQFVRLRLIERGDMVKGSPRGLWEISDQGRDRLANR
jgi:Mrr N-terminal domain